MGALVTVVVPTRNRRRLLARTLTTVLWQDHREIEVVVIDEASSDATPAFLAVIADDRVRVLRNDEPRGVSVARNRGLEVATGDYVAFVDDDDLWAPDKLSSQLRAVEASPGAAWSYGGAMVVDPGLHPVRWQQVPPADGLLGRLLRVNEIPGGASGVFAATELVRSVGCFDLGLKHFADWDLYIRLAEAAPAAPVDRVLLAYLRHQSMSNVPAGKYEDIDLIEARYAPQRAALGVPSNRLANLFWVAETSLRGGDRRLAKEAFEQARRLDDNRHARLRQVLALTPGYLATYDLLKRLAIPRGRRHEVEPWLHALLDEERELQSL